MNRLYFSFVRLSVCIVAAAAVSVGSPALGVGLPESIDLEIRQGNDVLLSVAGINTTGAINGSTAIPLGPAANGTEVSITITVDKPLVPDEPNRLFEMRINGESGGSPASLFDPLQDGQIEILISNMVFSGVDTDWRVAPWHPDEYEPINLGWLPFFYMLTHNQGFVDLPGAVEYASWASAQVPKDAWTVNGYGFSESRSGLATGMALTAIPDVSGAGSSHAGAPEVIVIRSWNPPAYWPPAPQMDPGFVDEMSVSINMRDVVADPVVAGAVSRKPHFGKGDLDIKLAAGPQGFAGTECRRGGPTQVILTFSEPVQAIDGTPNDTEVSLSIGILQGVSIAGPEMTIDMSGVPDASCMNIIVTGIADLAGNPQAGNQEVHITVLAGDTSGDGNTDLIDMAQTKSKNGSALVGADVRFDVNLDGHIDLIDMALIKSLNGSSVTCP